MEVGLADRKMPIVLQQFLGKLQRVPKLIWGFDEEPAHQLFWNTVLKCPASFHLTRDGARKQVILWNRQPVTKNHMWIYDNMWISKKNKLSSGNYPLVIKGWKLQLFRWDFPRTSMAWPRGTHYPSLPWLTDLNVGSSKGDLSWAPGVGVIPNLQNIIRPLSLYVCISWLDGTL